MDVRYMAGRLREVRTAPGRSLPAIVKGLSDLLWPCTILRSFRSTLPEPCRDTGESACVDNVFYDAFICSQQHVAPQAADRAPSSHLGSSRTRELNTGFRPANASPKPKRNMAVGVQAR